MRIGLIDQDLIYFPKKNPLNLELMKTAAFYKNRGDEPLLILKPSELEKCDKIIIFKNIPSDKVFSTIISNYDTTFYGLGFSDCEYEPIDSEIYKMRPYVEIYNEFFRQSLLNGSLGANQIKTLQTSDRVRLVNGSETRLPPCTNMFVVVYDNIVESDLVTDMFIKVTTLYSRISTAYQNRINTKEDFKRFIKIMEVFDKKFSIQTVIKKLDFLIDFSAEELYQCMVEYGDIIREKYLRFCNLTWNITPKKIYAADNKMALDRLADTLFAYRICAYYQIPIEKKISHKLPFKINVMYLYIGELWFNYYKRTKISFENFIYQYVRHGVGTLRLLQKINEKFLKESLSKEVRLGDEKFFI